MRKREVSNAPSQAGVPVPSICMLFSVDIGRIEQEGNIAAQEVRMKFLLVHFQPLKEPDGRNTSFPHHHMIFLVRIMRRSSSYEVSRF